MTPIKIAIVGGECTGKTLLCETLANALPGLWVPEYLREFVDRHARVPALEDQAPSQPRREPKRAIGGVRVQGEADIVVRFAKCCSPVPGDPIVAFISRGRGVIVHTRTCPKTFNLDPARGVEVSWDEDARLLRPVAVQVVSEDKPGILAAISKCFLEHGVNIVQAKCKASEDGRGLNLFQVAVGHVDQLKKVLRAIQGIDGVISSIRL